MAELFAMIAGIVCTIFNVDWQERPDIARPPLAQQESMPEEEEEEVEATPLPDLAAEERALSAHIATIHREKYDLIKARIQAKKCMLFSFWCSFKTGIDC